MDPNDFFRRWIERKLNGRRWRLEKQIRTSSEYFKHHGPRCSYAMVTLNAEPAEAFSFFTSTNAWPSENDQKAYEPFVMDGIAYALIGGETESLLGIKITLESVVVHEVDSNGNAFFRATTDTMAKILRPGGTYLDNRVCLDL